MDMQTNLNFRGARVVKAVVYASRTRTPETDQPVALLFKSLHRANHLRVTMTLDEARTLAAELLSVTKD